MAFLDWITDRAQDLPKLSEKQRTETRELFAEWRHDYTLAKQRNETKREPERGPIASPSPSREAAAKAPMKPGRLNDHDIPF